jgi:hypothetical protein
MRAIALLLAMTAVACGRDNCADATAWLSVGICVIHPERSHGSMDLLESDITREVALFDLWDAHIRNGIESWSKYFEGENLSIDFTNLTRDETTEYGYVKTSSLPLIEDENKRIIINHEFTLMNEQKTIVHEILHVLLAGAHGVTDHRAPWFAPADGCRPMTSDIEWAIANEPSVPIDGCKRHGEVYGESCTTSK